MFGLVDRERGLACTTSNTSGSYHSINHSQIIISTIFMKNNFKNDAVKDVLNSFLKIITVSKLLFYLFDTF